MLITSESSFHCHNVLICFEQVNCDCSNASACYEVGDMN